MEIDRDDADDELFGNLRAGQALSEQALDFDFAGGQAIGISGCWPGGWSWRE